MKANRKTRLLAAVLSLALLIMLLPSASALGEAHSSDYGSRGSIQTLAKYADVAKLREVLFSAIDQCKESADISSFKIPNTPANEEAIWYLIYHEMPLAFNAGGYFAEGESTITDVYLFYRHPLATYRTMRTKVELAAARLLQNIKGNSNLSEVQKALLLHDRLAEVCEYDYNDGDNKFNIYGALVEGKAACYGYAQAYDYLLEQVGMESYLCESKALDHAWNIIKVSGKYYHVDVTWDDWDWEEGKRGALGSVSHVNFLRSSTGIYSTGHKARDYDTYPTDTTFDSYFWQHSDAAFQLVGNEIYYIDNDAGQLKRYRDRKFLCGVGDVWRSTKGVWDNYARLTRAGNTLYVSKAKGVYRYDVAGQKLVSVYAPSLSTYQNIYGLGYIGGYLVCDINDIPPNTLTIKNLQQMKLLIDKTAPTGSITTTNNLAAAQTVTLKMSDNTDIAGYYWGTNSSYGSNPYTAAAASVTKSVTAPGTYYLTVKDVAGNVSATQSITFYKTTLNPNGGTVNLTSVLTAKGNGFTFPHPTRDDYKFNGWGASAGAASGVTALTPTGNTTYYALWKPCDHSGGTEIHYKAPTASQSGAWQLSCSGCWKVYESETIAAGHPFKDVTDSAVWSYSYAMYGKVYGLFKNASFSGSANITRAEFVTTLCRTGLEDLLKEEEILARYSDPVSGEFSDIAGQWFAPYARYMMELGVVGGNNKNQFNGNAHITREEVAAMVHRLVRLVDPKEKLVFGTAVNAFVDAKEVASWFAADVEWARKTGLFTGNSAKEMRPKAQNTRLEMAVVLQRFTMSYWHIVAI